VSLYGSLTREEVIRHQDNFEKGWQSLLLLDSQCRSTANAEAAFNKADPKMVYNACLCDGILKRSTIIQRMGEAYRALKLERFYENFEYGEI
jgi:hypothetical protein